MSSVPEVPLALYTISALVLVLVLKFFWNRRWTYYYASKIDGPFCVPFVGNIPFILGAKDRFYENLMELGSKYKRIGKMWVGTRLFVFVTDPDYIESIMKQCLARDDLYELATPAFGHGLLTAPPELWKNHRKIINQTFSQTILNGYHDLFIKHSGHMLKMLQNHKNGYINMFPVFCKTFFGIIFDTCIGLDIADWNKQDEYYEGLQRAVEISTQRLMNPLFFNDTIWYYFGLMKEQDSLTKEANDLVEKILDRKRKEDQFLDDSKKRDFLSHLIKMTDEEKWSKKELMDETQTMIVGGIDTSATTMSFLALMLGLHQDVQENVYQEMCSIFGESDRPPTLQDLDQMVYTERVIKESMRLFPVGPLLLRKTQKDIIVDGIVIPNDTTLMILTSCVHRDPNLWPNPLKFDPNRFLPEEAEKRSRYSHLPFGVPPRNCIGLKFAMMAMKVLLSKILRNYKIAETQYESLEKIKLRIKILLSADKGFGILLQPRNNNVK